MKTALSSCLFFSFLLYLNNPSYSRNAEWLVYNRSNSGLPSNTVYSVALDTLGNRWFGTLDGGAARFGGGEWIVYNCHNSLLPDNFIRSIAIENNEILWFAGEGLTRFANTGWYVYTGFNSDFICEYGVVVTIDGLGNKWLGARGGVGLARFRDSVWTVFDYNNSALPAGDIVCIAIDGAGKKWIGTQFGLACYNDTSWTMYTQSNSGLPQNYVTALVLQR